MEKDLVSIVMLSHNKGRLGEESVKSILAQTGTGGTGLFRNNRSWLKYW